MHKEITFALTACDRPDLLEITLDSFFKFNTYPIKKYIITEDSANVNINDHLIDKYKDKNIAWINTRRIGQIKSIDNMYSLIDTEYIFHCEDDWLFIDSFFIEKSLDILENNKKILQVWLRAHNDTNGHPIEIINDKYDVVKTHFHNIWHGFSFNPGLRRLQDYKLINNYASIGHEDAISNAYYQLGFRAAILKEKYVEHIGWGRHLNDIQC